MDPVRILDVFEADTFLMTEDSYAQVDCVKNVPFVYKVPFLSDCLSAGSGVLPEQDI